MPRQRYKCHYCDEFFQSVAQINGHVRNLHRYRNYPCLECPRTFSTYHGLTQHQLREHVLQCHLCEVTTRSWRALEQHQAYCHRQVGNFRLIHCAHRGCLLKYHQRDQSYPQTGAELMERHGTQLGRLLTILLNHHRIMKVSFSIIVRYNRIQADTGEVSGITYIPSTIG